MSIPTTSSRAEFFFGSTSVKFTEKQTKAYRKYLLNQRLRYLSFYGSARSGKTFSIVVFIVLRAIKYEGSKHIICRNSKEACKDTVWREEFLPILLELENAGVCKINTSKGAAVFSNGSFVAIGGLQPHQIGRILSTQWETIYINEANENHWPVVETLMKTRLNGTSKSIDGKLIPLKFLIDLNPRVKSDWDYRLFHRGIDPETEKALKKEDLLLYGRLHFKVEDNAENIDPKYIDQLKSMAPERYLRFYVGVHGSFDGLVYRFDESIHVIEDFDIPDHWEKRVAIDFGYADPFAILWGAVDPSNEILYLYREYYQTETVPTVNTQNFLRLSRKDFTHELDHINETYTEIVADHYSETFKQVESAGDFIMEKADKSRGGFAIVRTLLAFNKIRVFRSLTNLRSEFENYRKNPEGEDPMPGQADHLMDDLRYLASSFFPALGRAGAGRMN